MRIILLNNVDKLGKIGDEVTVKSGYARNFLIPNNQAILATKKNIEIFKAQQVASRDYIAASKEKAKLCENTLKQLGSIIIQATSGIEGKLFGSVGARDIAIEITKVSGFKISRSQVRLPNHSVLRTIGTHCVKIHIYKEIFVSLNVIIIKKASEIK
ncbi:50S ribosomal protein L9 [Candidatus Blochmannia ocreatus (nom. nud.)]|uniref:Large ribosomal subunit protein bL9 n=1 Tax=Candidatus Blochmannia ocreatus (nom. nud.) TaxID=251538 RepID=A0ABY4ST69_9ENTR|nr:50S ribosomal protein L9 [Candidatus Blochmannia ocreatus]URJ25172.1 50S ribosomal protein L9 [Candidatus Blochmannia ocreatus]